jgi:hypothetical protein
LQYSEDEPAEIEWTANERAKWQYIQHRNESLLPVMPALFPLGVLPHVCQACPCNTVGATIIMEGLRGLCGQLCAQQHIDFGDV